MGKTHHIGRRAQCVGVAVVVVLLILLVGTAQGKGWPTDEKGGGKLTGAPGQAKKMPSSIKERALRVVKQGPANREQTEHPPEKYRSWPALKGLLDSFLQVNKKTIKEMEARATLEWEKGGAKPWDKDAWKREPTNSASKEYNKNADLIIKSGANDVGKGTPANDIANMETSRPHPQDGYGYCYTTGHHSFQSGWLSCWGGYMMTAMWRDHSHALRSLRYIKCCRPKGRLSSAYMNSCYWGGIGAHHGWYGCKSPGYFMTGMYRRNYHTPGWWWWRHYNWWNRHHWYHWHRGLRALAGVRCCKNNAVRRSFRKGYVKNIWSSFDRRGWATCDQVGSFMSQIKRNSYWCNTIYCIEEMWCARTRRACPNMCSGHGRCNKYGHCFCHYGWAGEACDRRHIPRPPPSWGRPPHLHRVRQPQLKGERGALQYDFCTQVESGKVEPGKVKWKRDGDTYVFETTVSFSGKYWGSPLVTVAVNHVDQISGHNTRADAYAADVYGDEFTLVLRTWAKSKLYSLGVSWSAFGNEHACTKKELAYRAALERAEKYNQRLAALQGAMLDNLQYMNQTHYRHMGVLGRKMKQMSLIREKVEEALEDAKTRFNTEKDNIHNILKTMHEFRALVLDRLAGAQGNATRISDTNHRVLGTLKAVTMDTSKCMQNLWDKRKDQLRFLDHSFRKLKSHVQYGKTTIRTQRLRYKILENQMGVVKLATQTPETKVVVQTDVVHNCKCFMHGMSSSLKVIRPDERVDAHVEIHASTPEHTTNPPPFKSAMVDDLLQETESSEEQAPPNIEKLRSRVVPGMRTCFCHGPNGEKRMLHLMAKSAQE